MNTVSQATIRSVVAPFLLIQAVVWYAVALNFASIGDWNQTAVGAAGGTITFVFSERLRIKEGS